MSYIDFARSIVKRMRSLSPDELRQALRAVEKGVNRRTSKVRGAARGSMKDEAAAKQTLATVTKHLEQLRARKKFDGDVALVGRAILADLHLLMEGIKPYASMQRVCGRYNALNGSLALVTEGTEAAGFLVAVRRFRRDAHHIIKGSLADDERIQPLLVKLNKVLPDSGFDFTKHSGMPTIALTTDVHIASQSKLAKAGQYRTLDVDSFSKELDRAVDKAIPAKGKVKLEDIIRAHHRYYEKSLPTYAPNEGHDHLYAFMQDLLAAAKKVDQMPDG